MVISTGTGEVYQDRFEQIASRFSYHEANLEPESTEEEYGQMRQRDQDHFEYNRRHPEQPIKPPKVEDPLKKEESPPPYNIDQNHHVPLLASAIMGEDGNMIGLAIDHRAKLSDDDKSLLHLHEATELPYMNDLIKGGMKPSEAYGEAHKWATARETAASIAKWGQDGHEQYQQRMRDAAAIAKEPTDRDRHPDAHTTRYGLDESEGAIDKAVAEKQSKLLSQHPTASMAGLKSEMSISTEAQYTRALTMKKAGEQPEEIFKRTGWFEDHGQWKYEIPNTEAKLKIPSNYEQEIYNWDTKKMEKRPFISMFKHTYDNPGQKLSDILEHPKLFQAYPWLRDISIKSTPLLSNLMGLKGYYDLDEKKMALSSGTHHDILSTVLHEVQHAIQQHEGFEQGGNVEQFKPTNVKAVEKEFPAWKKEVEGLFKEKGIDLDEAASNKKYWGTPEKRKYMSPEQRINLEKAEANPGLSNLLDQYIKIQDKLEGFESEAFKKYKSLKGEVEARNVQSRMLGSSQIPWKTEDVPLHEQIFRHPVLHINPMEK